MESCFIFLTIEFPRSHFIVQIRTNMSQHNWLLVASVKIDLKAFTTKFAECCRKYNISKYPHILIGLNVFLKSVILGNFGRKPHLAFAFYIAASLFRACQGTTLACRPNFGNLIHRVLYWIIWRHKQSPTQNKLSCLNGSKTLTLRAAFMWAWKQNDLFYTEYRLLMYKLQVLKY